MKKLYPLILLCFFMASCKKKYNCRCFTSFFYNGGQTSFSSKTTLMSEKMNENQAKAVCENEQNNIDATYLNILTNNGNHSSNGESSSTICSVE